MLKKKNSTQLKTNFNIAEESSGFLLWKAANLLQRSHSHCLRPLGLTPAQFSFMTCLVYLNKNEGVTSKEISMHSGLDKMMVSDLVKTLLKKKWIEKVDNPKDNRSFLIIPTKDGVRLTNESVRSIEAIDQEFFSVVSNVSTLNKVLHDLIKINDRRDF